MKTKTYKDFAEAVQSFFCEYLIQERSVSAHTIRAYRDTFSQFLEYMNDFCKISAEKISLIHIDRQNILGFLNWLEKNKKCSPQTKVLRFSAIKSFCSYLIYTDPIHMAQWKSIGTIKLKTTKRTTVKYLTVEAVKLIFEQIPSDKLSERRNLTILSLLYYTGARVQELIDLTPSSIRYSKPYVIELTGKGTKRRIVPIEDNLMKLLQRYLKEYRLDLPGKDSFPLFSNSWGEKLTNPGITYILNKYVSMARIIRPDLFPKSISPHAFRHSRAMHLLQAGVNLVYIRDLMGHVSIQTTEIYARADSKAKREAIESAYIQITPDGNSIEKIWEKDKKIIDFLKSLS